MDVLQNDYRKIVNSLMGAFHTAPNSACHTLHSDFQTQSDLTFRLRTYICAYMAAYSPRAGMMRSAYFVSIYLPGVHAMYVFTALLLLLLLAWDADAFTNPPFAQSAGRLPPSATTPLHVSRTPRPVLEGRPAISTQSPPYKLFPITSSDSDPLPARVLNFLFVDPTKFVINTVGDLLRISGEGSVPMPSLTSLATSRLLDALSAVQPNGLPATPTQRAEIASLAADCEALNPTRNPASSPLMLGQWRLLYTDLTPAAPSSGRLGPFTGAVFQELSAGRIRNLLQVGSPALVSAELCAAAQVADKQTWRIAFQTVSVNLGPLRLYSRDFGEREVREWRITYLDGGLRIMRARNPAAGGEGFLFVLAREAWGGLS